MPPDQSSKPGAISRLVLTRVFLVSIVTIFIATASIGYLIFHYKSNIVWLGYSEDMFYKVEEVLSGLDVPWGMDFIDTENIIFTERSGNIGIANLARQSFKIIYRPLNVYVFAECGLLDIKVSPGFSDNQLVYFTYAKDINGYGYTTLAKAKLVNNRLENVEDVFVSKHDALKNGRHCGSRITFDSNDHIFMSIGDRGARHDAQKGSTHNGSIIRLNLDGSIPTDNPRISGKYFLPEIWSYGHRNPQGLFYDKLNNRLWSNEHGPRGGDEINLIYSGQNYGWPEITYGKEYAGPKIGEGTERQDVTNPFKVWSPSIAPSSLLVYRGESFPGWHGNLFSTALAQKHLNRLVIDSTGRVIFEERLLEDIQERFRSVIQDETGNIFLSTDSGRILKISHVDEDSSRQTSIFRHFDIPGLYISFDFKLRYW